MFTEHMHHAKILIVDDEVGITQLIEKVLRLNGYQHIRSLNDSRGTLSLLVEYVPDLIILDLSMPHVDGFQLLDFIQPLGNDSTYLPILVVTAQSSFEARRRALSSGAIDFILKPFIAEEILLRVRNMLQLRFQQLELEHQKQALEREVIHRTHELEESQLELREAQIEVVTRLAQAAEQHDDDTAQHTQRVGLTCTLLAQSLGLPESQVELLGRSSLLHDVGKIGIPDAILRKPGRLTEQERVVMQQHCEIGASLLSGGHSELMRMAERVALTHHQRWDGTGYPHGLRGEEIPIEGRILAVADVFDALTHERPYKAAWPLEKAVAEIAWQRGRHFDPQAVDAFMSLPHEDLI